MEKFYREEAWRILTGRIFLSMSYITKESVTVSAPAEKSLASSRAHEIRAGRAF